MTCTECNGRGYFLFARSSPPCTACNVDGDLILLALNAHGRLEIGEYGEFRVLTTVPKAGDYIWMPSAEEWCRTDDDWHFLAPIVARVK